MTEQKNKTENFKFDKMRDLYENGNLKDYQDCKNYISKYFTPLDNSSHAFIYNNKLELINDGSMNTVYLPRFEKLIKDWYKKKTIPKRLICNIHEPQSGEDFINASPQIKKERKLFESFSQEIKNGVKRMLDFIKVVWADNNDKSYNYLLKWFSNMIHGNKNQTALYARSIEGIGKSTLIDFISEFVLGFEFMTKGDTDVLLTSNNMSILGKLLVLFEELPVLNIAEWNKCDSKLKDLITGKTANYTDKYMVKILAENISNFVILTNHKAVKRPDGRRLFVVDLNTKYQNNFEFFKQLRELCFNKNVGYAFYNYLMEIDIDKFNSADMPLTELKKDAIAELLHPIEKFLKFNYILKFKSIKCKVTDLKKEYEEYLSVNDPKYSVGATSDFVNHIKQLGYNCSLINGLNCYRISYESLKELADKKHWLHKLDNDLISMNDDNDDNDDNNNNNNNDYEYGIDKKDQSIKMTLEQEIQHHQTILNTLRKKQFDEIMLLKFEPTKPTKKLTKKSSDKIVDINDVKKVVDEIVTEKKVVDEVVIEKKVVDEVVIETELKTKSNSIKDMFFKMDNKTLLVKDIFNGF